MTAVGRISSFALQNVTLKNTGKAQADLFNLQKQISSGNKTDQFAGLPGQVERFSTLEQKIHKTEQYIQDNTVISSRLEATQASLDQALQIADDFENLLTLRRNPAVKDDLAFAQQADALRDKLASVLNQTLSGRYIFGGTRTNVPPVDSPVSKPITPGVADANYYQGSTENTVARIDDNLELEYNVRADDLAFQQIFSAIEQGIQGDANDADSVVASAQTLMRNGIDNLIATQASVNADIVNVRDIVSRQESFKNTLEGFSQEIINTDLVEASTRVALDQAVLQASFQAYSVISQLRLVDFIR